MPKILQLETIDGALWMRMPTDAPSPVYLWTDAEAEKAKRAAVRFALEELEEAGYVIVPKKAPDGWAMVNVSTWDNLLRMISAAEKDE